MLHGTTVKQGTATRTILLIVLVGVAMAAALLITGCSASGDANNDATDEEASTDEEEVDYAQEILDSMTTEEKVAQLFIVSPEQLTDTDEVTQAGDTTKEALENYPVGGLLYNTPNLVDPDQTKEMLENTQSFSKYGLFMSVDEEGGSLVARIANNDGFSVDQVPDMATIGDDNDATEAYEAGSTIGTYLSDLGFNLDFAPVADVLTNPDNEIIGARSFGSDPEVDANMVAQVVKGLQDAGVLATLKHFPGHGETTGDSHSDAVVNKRTLDQLESTEFVPFEAGIDAGAACVMVGHISLPKASDDNLPATLSSEVVTDWLRGKLGFDGVVVTDSMGMGAITNYYKSDEAAVMAIDAGCDIILTPEDFETAYQGVLDAVKDGSLSEERLDESVYRILTCKLEHTIISTDDVT